jgi:hypothetical protein
MSLFTLRKRPVKKTDILELRLNKTEEQTSFYQKQISNQLEELIESVKDKKQLQQLNCLEKTKYPDILENYNKSTPRSIYTLNNTAYKSDIFNIKDNVKLGINNGVLTTFPTNVETLDVKKNLDFGNDIIASKSLPIKPIPATKTVPVTIEEIHSIKTPDDDKIVTNIYNSNTCMIKIYRLLYINISLVFILFIILAL